MSDPTKLYRVEFSGACYVRATSWQDALEAALSAAEHDTRGAGLTADVPEDAEDVDEVPDTWRGALPWQSGETGLLGLPEMTCGEMLGVGRVQPVTNDDGGE